MILISEETQRLRPRLLDLSGPDFQKEIQHLITTESKKLTHAWTSKEKEVVRRLYGKVPNKVIAEQLGLTLRQVKGMGGMMGLGRRRVESRVG